jgi:hypothetical protein
LFKFVIILYIVCFLLYIPFSRDPDLFEAEKVPVTITRKDNRWIARYGVGNKTYETNADYIFRENSSGDKAFVIYDPVNPKNATLYKVWGYWLTAKEVLFSLALIIVLFAAAVFITGKNSNALYSENELRRRRKYDL